jgi:hypothetical protein
MRINDEALIWRLDVNLRESAGTIIDQIFNSSVMNRVLLFFFFVGLLVRVKRRRRQSGGRHCWITAEREEGKQRVDKIYNGEASGTNVDARMLLREFNAFSHKIWIADSVQFHM